MNNKKLFHYFWGAVVILLPIWVRISTSLQVEDSKELFFIFSCLLSFAFFGMAPVKDSVFYCVISIFVLSFFNQFDSLNPFVVNQSIFLMLGIGLYFQFRDFACEQHEKIIISAIAITCAIQSLWVFSEFMGFDPYSMLMGPHKKLDYLVPYGWFQVTADEQMVNGSLTNENWSGALIALTFPALFYWRFYIFIPVSLLSLYLLKSAMPVTSAFVGICAYIAVKLFDMKKIKNIALVASIFPALLVLIGPPKTGFFESGPRVWLWERIWSLVHWYDLIIGKGVGFFAAVFPTKFLLHSVVPFRQMHNEYLEILFAFGVIGLAIFYYLYLQIYKTEKLHPIFYAIIAAALFNSIGHFTFHVTSTALVGIIAYSFLTKKEIDNGGFI